MRFSVVVLLLACSVAVADPKAPDPDLVVTWKEGEMSRDMSIWTTTIAVTGTKLRYKREYAGRNSGWPGTKSVELDAPVKDPKKVGSALAALDKIKVKPAKKPELEQMRLRSGCVRRGKAERCASASGTELKAIAAVRDALLDGVKIPTSL